MSVVDVVETWRGQESSVESPDGTTGSWRRRRAFNVTVDDPANDNDITILLATGVPKVRDAHPSYSYLRCVRVTPKRITPLLFEVECEYIQPTYDPNTSPVMRPAKKRWSSASTEEAFDEDVNGNAIVNSNGESPDPPLTKRISDLVLTISRAQDSFDAPAMHAYKDHVNSSAFYGYPPGTAVCLDIEAEDVNDIDNPYWQVTYTFQFRLPFHTTDERAWYKRWRNEGYLVRVDANGDPDATADPSPKKDEAGDPWPGPVLLKEDGTEETDPAAAFWNEHQAFDMIDFGALNL